MDQVTVSSQPPNGKNMDAARPTLVLPVLLLFVKDILGLCSHCNVDTNEYIRVKRSTA